MFPKDHRSFYAVLLLYTMAVPTEPASKDEPKKSRNVLLQGAGNFKWRDFPVYTEAYEDDHNRLDDDISTHPPEPVPHFEDGLQTNITAQLGGKVILNCKVTHLGDKTISWVRRRGEDFVLLSSGRLTLASDGRWSLQAVPQNDDWKLQLRPVAARDQGTYECQVSTHPPMVRQVILTVLVPKVEIVDERGVSVSDKFYKEGSIIELRCVISRVPQPSGQVIWTHAGRQLNFDTKRGGISVKTEVQNSGALSRLYIANAARKDSGNYTCALEDVSATTVAVHVLRGENPLAMQRGVATPLASTTPPALLLFALAIS